MILKNSTETFLLKSQETLYNRLFPKKVGPRLGSTPMASRVSMPLGGQGLDLRVHYGVNPKRVSSRWPWLVSFLTAAPLPGRDSRLGCSYYISPTNLCNKSSGHSSYSPCPHSFTRPANSLLLLALIPDWAAASKYWAHGTNELSSQSMLCSDVSMVLKLD